MLLKIPLHCWRKSCTCWLTQTIHDLAKVLLTGLKHLQHTNTIETRINLLMVLRFMSIFFISQNKTNSIPPEAHLISTRGAINRFRNFQICVAPHSSHVFRPDQPMGLTELRSAAGRIIFRITAPAEGSMHRPDRSSRLRGCSEGFLLAFLITRLGLSPAYAPRGHCLVRPA